jgi:hypothetical protein
MADESPAPKFHRFERVRVVGEPHHYPELLGRSGTVLWRDAICARLLQRPHLRGNRWEYLVYFVGENEYRRLLESDLQSEGTFDLEEPHLGTRPEVSFDVVVDDDMDWVDGTYRLPNRFWEVMIFGKQDVSEAGHQRTEWPSGITGVVFVVPRGDRLNRQYVQQSLAAAFGIDGWVEVRGPDSMVLR